MNNKLYFENIDNLSNLYLEKVIMDFEEIPIVFICNDDYNQKYLCLCSEIRKINMWIITRTDIEGIINLLEGKIDLYSALRINPRVWKVERNFSGEQTSNYITLDMVDELDWPDQDVYIEEDDGDFDEYLKSLNDSINDNTFTLEENLIAEPCVFEIFRIQGDSCKGEFEFNLNVKPKEFPEDFITERDYFTAA